MKPTTPATIFFFYLRHCHCKTLAIRRNCLWFPIAAVIIAFMAAAVSLCLNVGRHFALICRPVTQMNNSRSHFPIPENPAPLLR